ncbi:4-hydroxy-tetrahydrodipicolinate reductase [Myxococcota bacterium]
MKIALHGATGRLGQSIVRLSRTMPDLSLVGAVCAAVDPNVNRDVGEVAGIGPIGVVASADVASALLGADVVIDFSLPAAMPTLLAVAVRHDLPVMSGTTNLDPQAQVALEQASRSVPVLWAPNTSLGAQVLAELVTQAVRRLGAEYDVEIVEVHHRRKLDAPSGTARRLAEAACQARPELNEQYHRASSDRVRAAEELAVLAVRGGDVVGDHTVHLLGPGERLELTHRATNRELFAAGALRAARFLVGRPPGLYRITDMLGS